jgi:hypothetical protein
VEEHGGEEGDGLVAGKALGAAGELGADFGVGFVFGEVGEFFRERGKEELLVVGEEADAPEADLGVGVVEGAEVGGFVEAADEMDRPEGFEGFVA